MANYICIDGGTTNTRISLVKENEVIASLKLNIGARIGIDDKTALKNALKEGISNILKANRMIEADIKAILASGMITSELGLIELKHIYAPVGVSELHNNMETVDFPEISSVPFTFVRGVKIQSSELSECDMMRGEETEIMGIVEGAGTYILCGSHSKVVSTDNNENIIHFKTMLTGEMIWTLSQYTILKDCVDINCGELDEEYLEKGYKYSNEHGINDSLFKARVLNKLYGCNKAQTYSFFMGVVLCDEINYILSLKAEKIVVSGREQIKKAMAILLERLSEVEIFEIPENKVANSTVNGLIKVYEYN